MTIFSTELSASSHVKCNVSCPINFYGSVFHKMIIDFWQEIPCDPHQAHKLRVMSIRRKRFIFIAQWTKACSPLREGSKMTHCLR